MIHEIAPHHFHNEYRPERPEKDSILLCYRERKALVGRDGQGGICFPTFRELEDGADGLYEGYTYLFTIDRERYYLGTPDVIGGACVEGLKEGNVHSGSACGRRKFSVDGGVPYGEGTGEKRKQEYAWEDVEIFRRAAPAYRAFAGITGAQLYRWYGSRRFCGRCGAPMRPDGRERMVFCDRCGQREYPKIMPAVIVAVTHGNRILLTQYADRDYKKYALVAGFAEIGEPIEDTVRREVMEEVGLRVKDIRYYRSQPWSFTDTLLMGFYAELDGEEEVTLDREELALAVWFEREEIPVEANHVSLTNEMIMRFKEGHEKRRDSAAVRAV